MRKFTYDVLIFGGFGHVGLPLGIVFAEQGFKTCLYDIDKKKFGIIIITNMINFY